MIIRNRDNDHDKNDSSNDSNNRDVLLDERYW